MLVLGRDFRKRPVFQRGLKVSSQARKRCTRLRVSGCVENRSGSLAQLLLTHLTQRRGFEPVCSSAVSVFCPMTRPSLANILKMRTSTAPAVRNSR